MPVNRIGDQLVDGIQKAGQYAVDFDGTIVPLLSLPPGALDEIQREFDVRWNTIILDPLGRLGVAVAIIKAAAKKAGVPEPGDLDAQSVFRMFVEIPDDMPPMPDVDHLVETEADPTDAS